MKPKPLDKDLQEAKNTIFEFKDIAIRVLQHLQNVISDSQEKQNYIIFSSEIAGTKKYIRPVNKLLFINEVDEFNQNFSDFEEILTKIRTRKTVKRTEKLLVDKVVYTIQQSIGAGLDLLVNPNSARKHVGNRFEELIRSIFTEIGIANKKLVLKIPYETVEGIKTYKCENDLVLSPYKSVKSTTSTLDEKEIVVSVKTTSKDRMGKMFIDKMLLERFVKHPQKVIGIFLNDIQRKGSDNVSYTLVSGLFMVYTKFLTELEGIYYLDPPINATKSPLSKHMKKFSELITDDIQKLLFS